MSNILERYGIKEVADVTFYELTNDGTIGTPVLFLDTLKVSNIEQTAQESEAKGGKGNSSLISWDYGKEVNVALTDALFSAKSLAIMFGDGKVGNGASTEKLYKTYPKSEFIIKENKYYIDFFGSEVEIGDTSSESKITEWKCYTADGSDGTVVSTTVPPVSTDAFLTIQFTPDAIDEIVISADTFPGNYYVTGDTYSRSEITGKDSNFQFIIPKAKVKSENTITLEAEGDPSVFNLSLKVLRPADGKMMKLIRYDITPTA